MPTSDEHLRRLAERRREDGPPRRRGVWLFITACAFVVVAVVVAGSLSSRAVRGGADVAAGSGQPLSARVAAWWLAAQPGRLGAPSGDPTPVQFTIAPGEGLADVSERLASEGLVRDAGAFRRLAQVRGLDRKVQAGTSTLRRNMTAEEVLGALLAGRGPSVRVTIPEGWRAEQIADRLAGAGVVDRAEFLRLVGQGAAGGQAASDRPAGTGLEGYLFPDTYDFVPGSGAAAALERLLGNFDAHLTPDRRERTSAIGLSLYEVVTLASIVEREATVPSERGMIARVFRNRLAEPPYLLNADPTVQYALGYQPDAGVWWKVGLTQEDLAVDSAYNTYVSPGLPPGPIASPGLASIEAVLEATPGDWLYFVLDGDRCDGTHAFASSWDEHLANVARYRASGCAP